MILLQGGLKLWGHKLVLQGRGDGWQMSGLALVEELDLSDIRYEVAYAMIKWVYTDEIIPMDVQSLLELLQASTRFKLESLHLQCQKVILGVITEENCHEVYNISGNVDATILQTYCLRLMQKLDKEALEEGEMNDDVSHDIEMAEGTDDTDNLKTIIKPQTSEEQPYSCHICYKPFVRIGNLQRHIETHDEYKVKTENSCKTECGDEKCINCELCEKSFVSQTELIDHRHEHSEADLANLTDRLEMQNSLKCGVCEKHFPSKSEMKDHRKVHKKPLNCKLCEKVFSSAGNMQRHLKIHMGEKAFKCDECGQNFSQKNDRDRHRKIHTGEMGFKCDNCGKMFNRKSTLNKHLRTHTKEQPYTCNLCNKKFTNNSSLRRHIRIHMGDRQFACDYCPKTFVTRSDMARHGRVHIGSELMFDCHYCTSTFKLKRDLLEHIDWHSTENTEIQYVEFTSKEAILDVDPSVLIAEYEESITDS